jgi:hypothetical protein
MVVQGVQSPLGGPDARPSEAHYSDDWEGVDSFARLALA